MSPSLPFTSLTSLEFLCTSLSAPGATSQVLWEEGLPPRVMA